MGTSQTSESLADYAGSTASLSAGAAVADAVEDVSGAAPLSTTVRLLRTGAASIALYQSVYIAHAAFQMPLSFRRTWPFDVFALLLGIAAAAIPTVSILLRRWRPLVFIGSSLLIIDACLASAYSGMSGPAILMAMLVLIGTAALMPWEPPWQLGLSAVALAAMAAISLISMQADPHLPLQWLGMVTTAFIANMAVKISHDHRVSEARNIDALRKSHALLKREIRAHEMLLAEREIARQQLAASEATLRRVFDASLDAITITRATDGMFLDVNRVVLETNDLTREQIIGHTAFELGFWNDLSAATKFYEELKRSGEIRECEQEFRTRDGRRMLSLTSAVLMDIDGEQCVVSFSRDITAAKRVQRELEAAREAALAASRAKSEFLSSMSHEIRTPMNSILGMTDMLAETDLTPEQRHYVTAAIANGNALLELINSILDLAKVESGRLQLEATEFSPEAVAEQVLDTLAVRAHEKGLELVGQVSPTVPKAVVGDPLRLQQILVNLVGNAIKFTNRGEVVLSIDSCIRSKERLTLAFSVSDTGLGIPADKVNSIFSPFTQADSSTTRRYGGTGLGLAIVSRLVSLMNGQMSVTSEVGRGSRFGFTAEFDPAEESAAEARAVNEQLSGVPILIASANQSSSKALESTLANQGAHVTNVSDASRAIEAAERARSLGAPFAVAIIDGRIPPAGGIDLVARLERSAPPRPVSITLLATDDMNSRIAELKALGSEHYLVKPVGRNRLIAAVRAAIASPSGHSSAAEAKRPAVSSSFVIQRPLEILLADDSVDNRALVNVYLKKTPYRLHEVENGQDAINRFMAGRFDLVLMDIQMPVVDGYDAVLAIRQWEREQSLARTPIIALTASLIGPAIQRAREVGCDLHVAKPVKKATLLKAIHDAVLVGSGELSAPVVEGGTA
jgi:PAS domain S-box-containing protein